MGSLPNCAAPEREVGLAKYRLDEPPTHCAGSTFRECARSGVLRPGYACRWIWRLGGKVTGTVNLLALDDRLILSYRHRSIGGEWQDETYPALIARTPCHYGGSRPWFVCPVDGCGRRVAILYGAHIFACRRSHHLAYAGTREGTADRAARRADRIRTG